MLSRRQYVGNNNNKLRHLGARVVEPLRRVSVPFYRSRILRGQCRLALDAGATVFIDARLHEKR